MVDRLADRLMEAPGSLVGEPLAPWPLLAFHLALQGVGGGHHGVGVQVLVGTDVAGHVAGFRTWKWVNRSELNLRKKMGVYSCPTNVSTVISSTFLPKMIKILCCSQDDQINFQNGF